MGWDTWKYIIIPELILVLLVTIFNIWRSKMGKCKFKSKSYERKLQKARVEQYKRQGYADEEWISYHWCFVDRQRKIIKALKDNLHGAPDLKFEELDNLPKEDMNIINIPEDKKDDICVRWEAILTLMLYYLERMDESSQWNHNEYDDDFYAVFIEQTSKLDEKKQKKLKKDWESRNDKIRKDMDRYKDKFFKILSKYFYHMWV